MDTGTPGKRPPPFPHTPWKNLGRRVCVQHIVLTVWNTHFPESVVFFFNFKDTNGKGTITNSGGKNSLIQKLSKSRNSEYITKPFLIQKLWILSRSVWPIVQHKPVRISLLVYTVLYLLKAGVVSPCCLWSPKTTHTDLQMTTGDTVRFSSQQFEAHLSAVLA